jgi:hypothetical protein
MGQETEFMSPASDTKKAFTFPTVCGVELSMIYVLYYNRRQRVANGEAFTFHTVRGVDLGQVAASARVA